MHVGLVALVVSTVDVAYASDCIVLFDYNAREADELSVSKGEQLTYIGLAEGEDEWGQCKSAAGRIGVLPLSYLKVLAPVVHNAAGTAPSKGGERDGDRRRNSALSIAAAAHNAAATDDDAGTAEPAVREAMRRYRTRRARYNSGSNSSSLRGRWGVRFAAGPPKLTGLEDDDEVDTGAVASEHRSGIDGVPFFNLVAYMDEHDLDPRQVVRKLARALEAQQRDACIGRRTDGVQTRPAAADEDRDQRALDRGQRIAHRHGTSALAVHSEEPRQLSGDAHVDDAVLKQRVGCAHEDCM